ncbi:MAG: hypothetical protein ABSE63_10530 [Thermoguttaceae bacterium]|jgi:hypothetical protein
MSRKKAEPNSEEVFLVAKYFFDGKKAREIKEQVNKELKLPKPLSREGVYPLLAEARRLNYIRLIPPLEEELARQIAEKFSSHEQRISEEQITVVRTGAKHLNEFVAHKAAEVALGLIREIAAATKNKCVGLGLGPGRATLDFCQHLSLLLHTEPNIPPLNLYAICAGSPANYPEYASSSFFNLFPRNIVKDRIGLFAETVVHCRDFEEIKTRPGVAEAFAAKKEIDIVASSMVDLQDPMICWVRF